MGNKANKQQKDSPATNPSPAVLDISKLSQKEIDDIADYYYSYKYGGYSSNLTYRWCAAHSAGFVSGNIKFVELKSGLPYTGIHNMYFIMKEVYRLTPEYLELLITHKVNVNRIMTKETVEKTFSPEFVGYFEEFRGCQLQRIKKLLNSIAYHHSVDPDEELIIKFENESNLAIRGNWLLDKIITEWLRMARNGDYKEPTKD